MRWIRYILVAFVLLHAVTEANQPRKKSAKSIRKRNPSERRAGAPEQTEETEEGGGINSSGAANGAGEHNNNNNNNNYNNNNNHALHTDPHNTRHNHHHHQGHNKRVKGEQQQQQHCATCSNMDLQIRKQRRIEEIKDRVLTATGLVTPPDMTGVVISQNPNIQGIIHEMENSVPHQSFMQEPPYNDDEPGIKRERIFSPVEPGNLYTSHSAPAGLRIPDGTDVLYFKLDHEQLGTRVKSAILHVWLKPMRSDLDRDILVSVYKVVRPNNTNDFIEKSEVTTVRETFDANEGSWVKIRVYKLLQEWLNKPYDNLGLVVEAFDSRSRQVAVTDPTESPSNAPLLEIHTEENRRVRNRRNSGNFHCINNDTDRCCRYPLSVNFVEMGWDFIVAPKVYDANFCNGECPYLYAQKYAHTALIQKMNSTNARHGPCCGARKLSPMKMLYYDHDHKIKFDTIQDMVVERCGCS